MELKQVNINQLHQLISTASIGMELEFCVGSIPPKHVLYRSVQHAQSARAEIWSLPYMMLNQNHVVGGGLFPHFAAFFFDC